MPLEDRTADGWRDPGAAAVSSNPQKPLTPVDRELLQRCLAKQPGSWNDFVDRFLSLVYHVVQYTAHLRSARLNPEDVEDIAAEVLLQIVADDYKVLRQFKGHASLATYLTVIARRICVHELNRRQTVKASIRSGEINLPDAVDDSPAAQKSVESLEEVERLLRKLKGTDREVVRLFYLEGRTYEEISTETNIPVNTIGAMLSRARKKLREYATEAKSTSTTEIQSLKRMVQAEANEKKKK
jgi:RNA polymerase sigma-70 factor (ECF subfamily)